MTRREQELQQLVGEQADNMMDQAARIAQLERELKEARELVHIGGWSK